MKKIFVSAYACEPGLGSEIGVGWHWVLEMSRHFELWVLTRESNRQSIEPWIAEHPEFAGIHFLYYDLPRWARFWKKGLRGVRTYYNIWQRMTNGIVKRTMREEGIDTFHHLTYGNAVWPVSRFGQRQTFVWGPIGGLETIPEEYSRCYGLRERLTEAMRRWLVRRSAGSGAFSRRCRNAALILCKTEITRNMIPPQYRDKAVMMTDVAPDCPVAEEAVPAYRADGTVSLLTVGRLDAWRGFDLCIEALAMAAKEKPQLRLTIVGKGNDMGRLQQLAAERGVADKVTLAGKVSMEEYRRLIGECDAVVNAALKEGAVTVSFDAMALGKPLICLDTTGYTRYFNNDYARLLPVGGRQQTIAALAGAMAEMADCDLRLRMGAAAREAARSFGWRAKGDEIARLFAGLPEKCPAK